MTDTNGRFALFQLRPGSETLLIQAAGYLPMRVDLPLQRGQALELGTIRLKAANAGNASTVTITGVAKYTDGGGTYLEAANATVMVGALTAVTDANGEYTLADVPPGAMSLKAAYSTYPAYEASFDAAAGQQVRVDPFFIGRTAGQSTLKVVVTNQATGSVIPGATVVLNGISTNTNAQGEVSFATGVVAGNNTVAVSASGHDSRILTIQVQGIHSINLPVTLAPMAPGAPTQTMLRGVITDAGSYLPLAGVTVTVEGTGRMATTDAAGRYAIGGVPEFSGVRDVRIEKPGYQAHVQSLTLVQGRTHQFDVSLQQQTDPSQPIRILVSVTDKATLQPVENATITLTGSNPHVLQTNAAGTAQASGLNAGATQVQVSAPGYDNAVFSTNLQAGLSYRLPVELVPQVIGSTRIHGMVLDAQSRQPLVGAEVILAGTKVTETTTDARGHYEFSGLTPGRWNLAASAAGYKGSSRGYDVAASSEVNIPLAVSQGIQMGDGSLRTIAVGHPNNSSAAVGYLFVFGAQGTSGTVASNDGAINYGFTIDAGGVAELMVPSDQFLSPADTVLGKALFVYASEPVSAYFLNREQYTTDMTYLLDVTALGTKYRVLDWTYAYSELQMSLTATEDGTVAVVTPAVVLNSGQPAHAPFEVRLNKGQSVLYTTASGNDPTGTTISANKPIAVFAGAQCANIPVGAGYCDHLFTQLPPVNHWSANYVIPKTANTGAAGNLVRILADADGTTLEVDGAVVKTLAAGEFYEIENAESLQIKASKPVLVGQFMKGSTITTGGSLGDPAFTYINGIDQVLSDYVFTAPTNLSPYQENYLNVAIPTPALATLQLNGVAVDVGLFSAVGSTGYSAGNIPIPVGPGRIKADSPFLVTISGFSQDDSYHTIVGANYSAGASGSEPTIAKLTVGTDLQSYPAQTSVQLQAAVANQGRVPATLRIVLRITDANGDEIARFAAAPLGEVLPGATVNHTQPWNTALYRAGNYTLIGTLTDTSGEVVGTASSLFAITAGGALNAPKATLTLATDKAEYSQNDRVRLDNLVRNLTANAVVDDARVTLTVRNPHGTVVFTHTHKLGQLVASGMRALDVQQLLKDAPVGTYAVEAKLLGSGNNLQSAAAAAGAESIQSYSTDVLLATASTSYRVLADPVAPGGPEPERAIPIPVNALWQLLLTAVALLGMGGVRVHKLRARRRNDNKPGSAQ
ncbi:carboxypeptidase regulatory-like domain-containing protein [Acidovorax sp. FG27]|uniref:carboxypeptidase regulatory-like domain-containing protein n=1 Tax=Acidovorax sp. FG27 TaxID=3133652 RepID=UPI0030E98552